MMFIIPSHTFAGDIVVFTSDNESPMARMESEYEKNPKLFKPCVAES